MNTNLPVANRKRKVPALLGLVLLLFAGGIQQAPAVTPSNARLFDWKQGTIPNPCLDDGLPIKLTKGNGKFVGGAMGFGLIAFG